MEEMKFLTKEELFQIPVECMPMMVLADNLRNLVSAGIKIHTHGCYGHFMWLIAPGTLASMEVGGFKRVKLQSFVEGDRMKFWYCPEWTNEQRKKIIDAIEAKLKLPWYKRRYDFLAYIGQLTGWRWIQSPIADICSETISYINLGDENFTMENPNPEEVNKWFEEHKPKYQIYGRYTPD